MAFALNNTEDFLIKQERILVPEMQKILTEKRRNATSRLYNSFEFDIMDKPNNTGFVISMGYADHGKYVLDNRRRYTKGGPSAAAIASIMNWIANKGISIGHGQIRNVMGTTNAKAKSTNANDEKKKFAYAIWYANKRRGATATASTNFLKPWNNLYQSTSFQTGLANAVAMDLGNQIQIAFKDAEINIKS